MYLYTLELPKREGPKGHPTFMEGGRTYMVQVLSHTNAPPPPSDRPECECMCVCVCVLGGGGGGGLCLLILKFFNNVSLKLLGSNSIGFGGGLSQIELGLIDFGLDRFLQQLLAVDRNQLPNCSTAAWLVYKEDPNPMKKKVFFPTDYNLP